MADVPPDTPAGGVESESPPQGTPATRDFRLYAPYPEGWEARVKADWEKEYCFSKNPGEDFFHLLQNGEVYVQRAREKYCLNCALKLRILSEDRLHWQHRSRHAPPPTVEGL